MTRPYFDSNDHQQNRLMGALGYIFFFVPLLANGKSAFNRYCANQGLLGAIVYIAVSLAFGLVGWLVGWIPLIGWLIRLLGNLVKLAVFALMLYHAYLAYIGKTQPLPFIGDIQLIR